MSEQESYDIIENWLEQCATLRRLKFNHNQKIREGLEDAGEGYFPISREKLKEENLELYLVISGG